MIAQAENKNVEVFYDGVSKYKCKEKYIRNGIAQYKYECSEFENMLGVSLITKREHTMVRKSFANRMKGPV
jgi:hypothetical protein